MRAPVFQGDHASRLRSVEDDGDSGGADGREAAGDAR